MLGGIFRLIMAIILVVIGLAIFGGALFILGPVGLLGGLFVVGLVARAYEFIGPVKYDGKNSDNEPKEK